MGCPVFMGFQSEPDRAGSRSLLSRHRLARIGFSMFPVKPLEMIASDRLLAY